MHRGMNERQDRGWPATLRSPRDDWKEGYGTGASGGGSSEDVYGTRQDLAFRRERQGFTGRGDSGSPVAVALPLAIGAGAALLGGWLLARSTHHDRHRGHREAQNYENYGRRSKQRSFDAEETGELIASSKVEGTAVYDRHGEKLGAVHNFMVGKRSGLVAYAVLSFGGVLGMGESFYPLPWNALTYDTRLGGYIVNIDKTQLRDAPRFSADQDPFAAPGYGRGVNDYWSILAR